MAGSDPSQENVAAEWLRYGRAIRRRWWLIGLLMLATLGTLAFDAQRPPEYEASLLLLVNAPPQEQVVLFDRSAPRTLDQWTIATRFAKLLRSETVAEQTVARLGLTMSPQQLADAIGVDASADSASIRVWLRGASPEVRDVLDAHLEATLEAYRQSVVAAPRHARELIARELERALEDLTAAEAELTAFQLQHPVLSFQEEAQLAIGQIRGLELQRAEATAAGETDRVAQIDQTIAARQKELRGLVEASLEYGQLRRQMTQAQARYDLLANKLIEASLREKEALNTQPVYPLWSGGHSVALVSTPRGLIFLFGGLLSLFVGLTLVVGLEHASRIWQVIKMADSHPLEEVP